MQRSFYRIEAPHFVAGFETETRGDVERVVRAAPILKWTMGKACGDVLGYCVRKGWKVSDDRKAHENVAPDKEDNS